MISYIIIRNKSKIIKKALIFVKLFLKRIKTYENRQLKSRLYGSDISNIIIWKS